jgi:hypothetical protein
METLGDKMKLQFQEVVIPAETELILYQLPIQPLGHFATIHAVIVLPQLGLLLEAAIGTLQLLGMQDPFHRQV